MVKEAPIKKKETVLIDQEILDAVRENKKKSGIPIRLFIQLAISEKLRRNKSRRR
jgi:hypothetical protein